MLRVTLLNDVRKATFKMEGKLTDEWVTEAERAWTTFTNSPHQQCVVVDLCGVLLVDDQGRALLARTHSAGAKLVGTGPMMSALIEEIGEGRRPTGEKWIRSLLALLFVPFIWLISANILLRAQDSAAKSPKLLTLEEAVNIAQTNNRQVKNAELAVAIDEDHIAGAQTYRFPSLNVYALGSQLLTPVDFTFEKGVFGNFPGIGSVPATNTKIHTHCDRPSMA